MFDIILSLISMTLLFLIFLLILIAVKIYLGTPLFFIQPRAALLAYMSKSWGVFNIGATSYSSADIGNMAIKITGKGKISIAAADQKYEPFNRFDLDFSLANASFGY